MSVPLPNLIQPQNIVINPHTIMTNVNAANNGIPLATALSQVEQANEIKPGMVLEPVVPMQTTVQQQQPVKTIQGASVSSSSNEQGQILTKQRLQDLVRDTDSTLSLEEEVEEIILGYVDEFVDRCLNGAALIAKNRQVKSIEVKDVQQFLNRNYDMWTPGFGTDELRPYKRSNTTEAHKQRMALIRKTLKKY